MRRKLFAGLSVAVAAAVPAAAGEAHAADVTFDKGSLIIPMDVDFQDVGMLKAFGLVDKLLRAGIPIEWVIKTPKVVVDASKGKFEDDFTASATDFKSGVVIASHGYRGGPFVIRAEHATAASAVITAWQTTNTTTVHVASASFTGNVSRTLSAAPRIAVFADGSQAIAFSYLNAAGIPDKNGAAWSAASPDVLTPAQVMGPTSTNHADGALFGATGQPAFCEIMTMHWKVNEPEAAEVGAELSSFLKFPVHVNAECQAVNALEGAPPDGGRAKWVTSKGFAWPAPKQPATVDFLNSALPFAQMDGPFKTVGGSEPAYALGPGSSYYDTGIVMVKAAGEPVGVQDVWMTGYANTGAGTCSIGDLQCIRGGKSLGKVSYLGGHSYDVKTPISTNPTTQGTRLFLNSLYEAGCVTGEGQGKLALSKTGPAETAGPSVTYTIGWANTGYGPALGAKIQDPLPPGSTFVSATGGGVESGGVVTWSLGDLAALSTGSVEVTITLPAFGSYSNTANGAYGVGLSTFTAKSNTVGTTYVDCATTTSCVCGTGPCDDAGVGDGATGDGATGDGATSDGATGDGATSDGTVAADASVSADGSTQTDGETNGVDPGAADAGTDAAGGCGCRVPPRGDTALRVPAAVAILALASLRRRRRA